MNIIFPAFIPGLKGEFTFAGKDYKLEIKKVYTQVTNGRFQVDMEFEGEVPQGIRRGQTLQIRLALSDETAGDHGYPKVAFTSKQVVTGYLK